MVTFYCCNVTYPTNNTATKNHQNLTTVNFLVPVQPQMCTVAPSYSKLSSHTVAEQPWQNILWIISRI